MPGFSSRIGQFQYCTTTTHSNIAATPLLSVADLRETVDDGALGGGRGGVRLTPFIMASLHFHKSSNQIIFL